ncbi:M20 metallopeptidase family protein [Macrococcus carouselicus]|uniref:Amidohydrolase n=1 Tax=Macrococcus carouselicus TaxID=69969 RepID=A0A9Q8CJ97_9STAP|nr:amidohydrolase [Macrococcus carouselicus]TDL96616.1 amidohydrolase [Macrococcus carouselicus]
MSRYDQYKEKVIVYRRYMHEHPELSFEEYETAKYIRQILSALPNCKVIQLTETSTVAVFNEGKGKKIGLRADIDALPVGEECDHLEYKSRAEGKMHACGHDGHAAILLGAAHYFNDHSERLANEIHCIFQHAEELIPGGAREMVATGYFDDFDFIYGHHLWAIMDTGLIDIKSGPASANSDLYELTIQGKGGHSSQPHLCIDPIVIGSQFISALQTITSRQIDPYDSAVISNTVFQAGVVGAENVIPEKILLKGSVRTTTDSARSLIESQLKNMIDHLCGMYGASYDFNYIRGYDAVINDDKMTAEVRKIAEGLYPGKIITEPPMMGGEDFSAFSRLVPSVYTFIGSGLKDEESRHPHHHPRFEMDEESFEIGFEMFVEVAEQIFSNEAC